MYTLEEEEIVQAAEAEAAPETESSDSELPVETPPEEAEEQPVIEEIE